MTIRCLTWSSADTVARTIAHHTYLDFRDPALWAKLTNTDLRATPIRIKIRDDDHVNIDADDNVTATAHLEPATQLTPARQQLDQALRALTIHTDQAHTVADERSRDTRTPIAHLAAGDGHIAAPGPTRIAHIDCAACRISQAVGVDRYLAMWELAAHLGDIADMSTFPSARRDIAHTQIATIGDVLANPRAGITTHTAAGRSHQINTNQDLADMFAEFCADQTLIWRAHGHNNRSRLPQRAASEHIGNLLDDLNVI